MEHSDKESAKELYLQLIQDSVFDEKCDGLCGKYYVYRRKKTAYLVADLDSAMLVRAMMDYRRRGLDIPQIFKDEYARRNPDRLLK